MDDILDYILVGKGIAGSVLAFQLIEKGHKIAVFDLPNDNKSSTVAAGLFNPLTGKNIVKTWLADELWSYSIPYYHRLERQFGKKYIYEVPQYRPFFSKENMVQFVNDTSLNHDSFIQNTHITPQRNTEVNDEFGGIEINQTGYLDIPSFLRDSTTFLTEKNCLREELFDLSELVSDNEFVYYRSLKAKRLVFCDGITSHKHPFFNWLNFKPVKGEVLHVTANLKERIMYNRGIFFLPHHDGTFRLGATYENDFTDGNPSEKGLEYLKNKASMLLKFDYEIVRHLAGIRPATYDRRPFVGVHPGKPNIYLLNGFGAKGVTLAPYFADNLIQFIEKKQDINKEASLARCYSLYLKDK